MRCLANNRGRRLVMNTTINREIERLLLDIRRLPERSQRRAVLLDRLKALRTKQIRSEMRGERRKRAA